MELQGGKRNDETKFFKYFRFHLIGIIMENKRKESLNDTGKIVSI